MKIFTGLYKDAVVVDDSFFVVSINRGNLKKWFNREKIDLSLLYKIDYQEEDWSFSSRICSGHNTDGKSITREIMYVAGSNENIIFEDKKLLVTYESLEKLATNRNKDKIFLCCCDESSEFCHRHLVAKKISSLLNKDILEYSIKE